MIRNRWLGITVVSLLCCSALATCVFAIRWVFAANELQRLQAQSDAMTRTSALMQQLAADAIDYGRRNPEIHTILNELNFRAAGLVPTNPPARPAAPRP